MEYFRDIKGANIFLTDDMKNLKLGDYGSAVKIKQHTTMPGELQGHVGTQGGYGAQLNERLLGNTTFIFTHDMTILLLIQIHFTMFSFHVLI